VLEYGFDLLALHAGKPPQELVHRGAALEILERALSGTRVPRNTQAPLTFAELHSTEGQVDQSNIASF